MLDLKESQGLTQSAHHDTSQMIISKNLKNLKDAKWQLLKSIGFVNCHSTPQEFVNQLNILPSYWCFLRFQLLGLNVGHDLFHPAWQASHDSFFKQDETPNEVLLNGHPRHREKNLSFFVDGQFKRRQPFFLLKRNQWWKRSHPTWSSRNVPTIHDAMRSWMSRSSQWVPMSRSWLPATNVEALEWTMLFFQ